MSRAIAVLTFIFTVSILPLSAATYIVTNASDAGTGSLRAAVDAANATQAGDLIVFSPSLCSTSPCKIILTSGELVVGASVTGGELTISNPSGPGYLIVSGNSTTSIFHAMPGSNLTIDGVAIEDGFAGYGGGILNQGQTTLLNSIIRNCSAVNGSAIYSSGQLSIARSEIADNHMGTSEYSIAIYSRDAPVTIRDSAIVNNPKGGIFMEGFGQTPALTLANSTLSGNGVPGAITMDQGVSFVTNSTLTNNWAGINAGWMGGLVYLRNSIVSDLRLLFLTVYNRGNNIIGQPALLGPLVDNGGPTRTHALLAGSPAIDSGNPCVLAENGCGDGNPALVNDQRGISRNGAVDIGAYEAGVFPIVYALSGQVTTSSGLPIRGARVILTDGSGNVLTSITSPFGYYGFEHLPLGTYTVTARKKGVGQATRTIILNTSFTSLDLIL